MLASLAQNWQMEVRIMVAVYDLKVALNAFGIQASVTNL